ncbi:fimbrial protein [Klebsiella aerogenes]|uniref:fimbrial protein n=1 Tax=Klebsiella aerogenes TaxID=548 RepID=UPI0007B38FA8|nr:fimbrial protein [Klebsiella aerogenes]EKZ5855736.1 type 1 fimbrial protein [Klebsiella aerogenes]EKZ6548497.1 type 1 fimbrial protein [Klebsiella aerogenes]EKZ6676774.1 type 1 fimbrial protein [Klebsiella aerogenes]KZR11288.1 hypothetical protein A3N65_12385 [Klebsiella aerogenes]
MLVLMKILCIIKTMVSKMKEKGFSSVCCILLHLVLITNCYAAHDTGVSFTATFTYVAPSCEITSAENSSVQMGTYWPEQFSSVGQETAPVEFHILLNCNRDIYDGVEVQFSGTSIGDDSTVLALDNTDNESTAQGLGIVIYDKDGDVVPIGQNSEAYTTVEGDNDMEFKASYRALSIPITGGTATATATFTIYYS